MSINASSFFLKIMRLGKKMKQIDSKLHFTSLEKGKQLFCLQLLGGGNGKIMFAEVSTCSGCRETSLNSSNTQTKRDLSFLGAAISKTGVTEKSGTHHFL